MDPTRQLLVSWPLDPWVVAPLVLAGWVYVRGWRQLRRRGSKRFGPLQLATFLGGLAAIFVALASPLDAFAGLLLWAHMLQHILLMMAAPPLLWLGAPLLPLLRGLPGEVRRGVAGPLLRSRPLRACGQRLTRPVVAWLLFNVSTLLWHVPRLYETALRSEGWHYFQHVCFLGTGLLFWYPVVRPYPARPAYSRWLLLPYLLLADVVNTALSALLTFAPRPLYPYYAAAPRFGRLTVLEDQALAGVLMWVPGSLFYLVPLVVIGARLLYGREGGAAPEPAR